MQLEEHFLEKKDDKKRLGLLFLKSFHDPIIYFLLFLFISSLVVLYFGYNSVSICLYSLLGLTLNYIGKFILLYFQKDDILKKIFNASQHSVMITLILMITTFITCLLYKNNVEILFLKTLNIVFFSLLFFLIPACAFIQLILINKKDSSFRLEDKIDGLCKVYKMFSYILTASAFALCLFDLPLILNIHQIILINVIFSFAIIISTFVIQKEHVIFNKYLLFFTVLLFSFITLITFLILPFKQLNDLGMNFSIDSLHTIFNLDNENTLLLSSQSCYLISLVSSILIFSNCLWFTLIEKLNLKKIITLLSIDLILVSTLIVLFYLVVKYHLNLFYSIDANILFICLIPSIIILVFYFLSIFLIRRNERKEKIKNN